MTIASLPEKRPWSPAPRAHRSRERAGARRSRRPGAGALWQQREGGDAVIAVIREPAARPKRSCRPARARRSARPGQEVRAIVGDRLDILVANAGISKAASIEDTTLEDFDRLFASTSARRTSCAAAAAGAEQGQHDHLHVLARRPRFGRHLAGLCRDQGAPSTPW